MRTHRSPRHLFAVLALALIVAIPAAVAAQTQRASAASRPGGVPQKVNNGAKALALPDAHAQAALEKRVQSLEQQVAALQASEAELQKNLLALQQTLATVQATALPVERQGANYIVTVPAGLTLHASGVTIQGDAAMTLKAGVGMDITAPARIGLTAANISLNAGSNGRGAARAGDDVTCRGVGDCNIVRASTSVIIGN